MDDKLLVFYRAVKANRPYKVLEILKKNRWMVDARDHLNETPLHWAVKRGLIHLVDMLLNYDADPTAVDAANRSCVDLADKFEYPHIKEMI